MDAFSLDGKIVVITGSSGQVGRQLVKAYKEASAVVIETDLEIEENPNFVSPIQMDVTNKKSVESALKKILLTCGHVDVLVNNAGVSVFTPFAERTYEEYMHVMDVNYWGTSLCSQVFADELRKTNGNIINIASIYGVVSPDPRIYGNSGRNNSEVYGASKAAIIQLTKYLAVHLAPVRVNCISPGGLYNNQDVGFVRRYVHKTPLGRMANNTDLARAAVFLASDEYTTGHNLVVDGGFTLW
jgi:NAD(P)-dependent dehydrogenase (short-subunit alcohol dehydrogenase family)